MTAFNPWTATFDEANAAQDALGYETGPDGPLFQWNAAQEVNALRAAVEAGGGFDVMDAVSRCLRHDLVAPDWLAREFIRRYDSVLNCRAGSWDDAFGRPHPLRKRLETLRQRRLMRWALHNFFRAPEAPPRTREGFEAAAAALGITPRQAEEWTPKTRKNTRGFKPYKAVSAPPANDPFSLTRAKKKPG